MRTGRGATDEEVARIVERLATAPFDPRPRAVPPELQGRTYLGLRLGQRQSAVVVHLGQRVLLNRQWADGTTEDDYLRDLRAVVTHERARIVIYEARGGALVGALAPNSIRVERLGTNALPWLYVAYSADRGSIISGYQASGLHTVRLGANLRWLK